MTLRITFGAPVVKAPIKLVDEPVRGSYPSLWYGALRRGTSLRLCFDFAVSRVHRQWVGAECVLSSTAIRRRLGIVAFADSTV